LLIRPRLTDHYGIARAQVDLDFAIPFLDEDIPLYVDPFLLWRSPSQQDQALHTSLINAFNHLGVLAKKGRTEEAVDALIAASECDEVGMGSSVRRKGKRLGRAKAAEAISLFSRIPQYRDAGFRHFEEMQLYIDGISKDRVSDIACSFLKSFLIDFTIDQCNRLGIPVATTSVDNVYDYRSNAFKSGKFTLPTNPLDQKPLLFVPKRWLRFNPWLNYEDYFESYCPQDDIPHAAQVLDRVEVLNYNLSCCRFDGRLVKLIPPCVRTQPG
jgi:hypothetical protein